MDDPSYSEQPIADLDRLMAQVADCYRCQRMAWAHVLGPANGPVPAPVMIIGEAPGRFGAAISGVPFSGDASGRRLQHLLQAACISRNEVFITNAVLCNPLNARGHNRRPTMVEVRRCSPWLQAQIDLVSPRLVVTLGTVALSALRIIEDHPYRLAANVGQLLPWRSKTRPGEGVLLLPLYHPSPRTAARRTWQQQEEDFRRLAEVIRLYAPFGTPGQAKRTL